MSCYIAHEEKLFSVQIYENKSCEQLSFTGNSALLPFDVIDFDFGEKQFHCLLSCDVEVTNESLCCLEKISSYETTVIVTVTVLPIYSR